MPQRLKIVIVLVAVLAIGAWVLVEAKDAVPIREGTAAGFWRHACNVNFDQSADHGCWNEFYAPREGWCIYYLPKPLEPLTQSEGSALAVTGGGGPGPVTLLMFGAMIGAICFVAATFLRRGRRKLTSTDAMTEK